MADIGGDGASMMMGTLDPSAFSGREEDLFLPGDSLFGFSAAAGNGSSPDVGDPNASFQGSASMLFPSGSSFQAMASLPPESDPAVASAADLSCSTSDSRPDIRDVSGLGAGERAGTECCANNDGDKNLPARKLPSTTPSLKQSLAAAMVSAAARDAANAVATATVAGGRSTATRTKKATLKSKNSARPRRRVSGGRGGRNGKTKDKTSDGSNADSDRNSRAVASAKVNDPTPPCRPTRNLRRPRQESKQGGQATTIAAVSSGIVGSADGVAAGDILGMSRARVASNPNEGGEPTQQAVENSSSPSASMASGASAATGGSSACRLSQATYRQHGVSPCRPPARRTSIHTPPPQSRSNSDMETAIGLPAGMEVIPGFEDTIDSHYMTALLQKGSSDTQSGVPASAFASAESQGLEVGNGGEEERVGEEVSFTNGLDACMGSTASLLLGCDTQPSAAAAVESAASDEDQQRLSEFTTQSQRKAEEGALRGVSEADRPDAPGLSMAKQGSRDPPSSLAPAEVTLGSPLAVSTPPQPTMKPIEPIPSRLSTLAALSLQTLSEAAVSKRQIAAVAPASDAAVEKPAATDRGAKIIGTQQKFNTAAPPRKAMDEQTGGATKKSTAPAGNQFFVAKSTEQSYGGTTVSPGSMPPVDGLNAEVEVIEVEEVSPGRTVRNVTTRVEFSSQKDGGTNPSRKTNLPQEEEASQSLSSAEARRGSLDIGLVTVGERASKESGGLTARVAPSRTPPAETEMADPRPPPPRPLPRKISLRFAPRDSSTENKLSKHGYLPFQKLTAPLSKPLEAVFKFMAKKWSGVASSDLNGVRIVLDLNGTDYSCGDSKTGPRPCAPRTIVWSSEHSGRKLLDLVRALPDIVLERMCDEEAVNLTYTFSAGPIGPPPPQSSLPWDIPQNVPETAALETPQPVVENQPVQRPGTTSATLGKLSPPAGVSKDRTGVGTPRPARGTKEGSAPPQALPTPGLEETRNVHQSGVGARTVGTTGGSPVACKRRSVRGGGFPPDIIANAALKRHYAIVKAMFRRQGIASPPVTHFLPGGLFARMHAAAVVGGVGAGMLPGMTALPQLCPTLPIGPPRSHTSAGTGSRRKSKSNRTDLPSKSKPPSKGGDGVSLELRSDSTGDKRGEEGNKEAGEALVGEETCMALFGGDEVEILVDPSSMPAGTTEEEQFIDVGDPEQAGQSSSTPLLHGLTASASTTSGPEDKRTASTTDSALSLTLPAVSPSLESANGEAQSVLPPELPPGVCASMGEETCMAAFSGGDGIDLLADPPLPAVAAGVVDREPGAGNVRVDAHIAEPAEPAVQPVFSLPTGGTAASACEGQLTTREVGRQTQTARAPTQSGSVPEVAAHADGASVGKLATTQPALAVLCGGDGVAAEDMGFTDAGGNIETTVPGSRQRTNATLTRGLEEITRRDKVADAKVLSETRRKAPPTAAGPPSASRDDKSRASSCSNLGEPRTGTNSSKVCKVSVSALAMPIQGGLSVESGAPHGGGVAPAVGEVSKHAPREYNTAVKEMAFVDTGPAEVLETPARLPPKPVQVPLTVPNETTSGPPRASLSTGDQPQQPERESVATTPRLSVENCRPTVSCEMGEAVEEAQVVNTAGIASESATVVKHGGSEGCGDAATRTTPSAPSSSQQAGGTVGMAAGNALLSQGSGRRKMTRNQSNGGGEPVSFGSSGGGSSSRPEEGVERVSKRARKGNSRLVPGDDSACATSPPQVLGDAKKHGIERRICGSATDTSDGGPEKKGLTPAVDKSGVPPNPAATPAFDMRAVDMSSSKPAATATPLADTGDRTHAARASRPFAFASEKGRKGSGLAAPLPLPSADEQDPPTANPMPVCKTPDKACRTSTVEGVAAGAFPAAPATSHTVVARARAVKARPFAFAAAAKKSDPAATPVAAATVSSPGRMATPPRWSGLSTLGVDFSSPHSRFSQGASSAVVDATPEHLASLRPPPPAAVRNSVSAQLSLSMSPEEVQAEYSEAWSSLSSCFWDESALLGGDANCGSGGDAVDGDELPAEGPVTRWLALPRTEMSVGAIAAGAPAVAAPAPLADADADADAAAVLPREGDLSHGRVESEARATFPNGAPASVGLSASREANQSKWASFCTAFASSGGSATASAKAGCFDAAASFSTSTANARSPEKVRSLPTLIRLGRSMSKGVALGEKDGSQEVNADAAATAPTGATRDASSTRELESSNGLTQTVAKDTSAAAGQPSKTFCAMPQAEAGHSEGGEGDADSTSDTLGGGRRKRTDCGGSNDGQAVPTALPKKRRKKKGRISPVFVSSLPPESFGNFATTFSSSRRA